jgi:hypothetical protein
MPTRTGVAGARKRSRIEGPFAVRMIEMLNSPAYRALSLAGHRVLSRIEIEFARHWSKDNGKLPITYANFVAYGVNRRLVSIALDELEKLGFIVITERGVAGNAEYRSPNKFRLTYRHTETEHGGIIKPTHEWRRIDADQANEIARQVAQSNRLSRGKGREKWRVTKNKFQYPTGEPSSVPPAGTEKRKSPVPPTDREMPVNRQFHENPHSSHGGTTIYSSMGKGGRVAGAGEGLHTLPQRRSSDTQNGQTIDQIEEKPPRRSPLIEKPRRRSPLPPRHSPPVAVQDVSSGVPSLGVPSVPRRSAR